MEYDNYTDALIYWLKLQEQDSVIFWATDHLSLEYPYCGSWIDVRVPEYMAAIPDSNWQFTIVHLDDEDLDEHMAWQFGLATDKLAWGVFDPNPPNWWYIEEVVLDKDVEPSPDLMAHLNSVANSLPNAKVVSRGVWSPAQVSEALNRWAAKYAGRGDLLFAWDVHAPISEHYQSALETMKKIEAGEANTYQIGETPDGMKIMASDQVMDFLLEEMTEEDK